MLELVDPELGWGKLANGMGVEAGRAESVAEFIKLFSAALKRNEPFLIEAVV
jgi:acetolactate synthase-1/2/3 large subunit